MQQKGFSFYEILLKIHMPITISMFHTNFLNIKFKEGVILAYVLLQLLVNFKKKKMLFSY